MTEIHLLYQLPDQLISIWNKVKTHYIIGNIEFKEYAYQWKGYLGRIMRYLELPTKKALRSICDGYFVNIPHKHYIKLKYQQTFQNYIYPGVL